MNVSVLIARRIVAATVVSACLAASALAQSVSFAEPADGATVSSPFKVKFNVTGMLVKPAGVMDAGTGHHHLLINMGAVTAGEVIPMDATHLHYGKGQTEADITLPPGDYALTMQFANGAHQSYGPALAQTIHVTVK